MKPVNILVINLHATDNAGDATLLDMTLEVLREAFPGCHLTLAMNVPDPDYQRPAEGTAVIPSFIAATQPASSTAVPLRVLALMVAAVPALAAALTWRSFHVLPPFLPARLRRLLEHYAAADIVVSCPGNIFASTGKAGLPLLLSAITVALAVLAGRPFYVLPQSIGPLNKRWQRVLVGCLYRRAQLVMVREPISLGVARQLGVAPARLHLIPDLAIAFQATDRATVPSPLAALLTTLPRPIVGVTVINRLLSAVESSVWARYEESMAEALERWVQRLRGSVIFFPQVTGPTEREDDRIAALRVQRMMSDPGRAVVLKDRLAPGVLKALYARTDLFVGTRMHSVIFATAAGVPTLWIEYLAKTRGLAEMLQMEHWCMALTDINATYLETRLDELWQQRDEVREALLNQLPALIRQVQRAAELIRSSYCEE